MKNNSYPFVLTVENIAGGTVEEGCAAAIELSRHLKCMVKTEINDTVITVCGDVMTAEDAYELWKQQNSKDSKSGDILLTFFISALIAIGVISTHLYYHLK
jgi:NDP-sugar pyrophosphorylase family protein